VLVNDQIKRTGPDFTTVETCSAQELKPGDLLILSAGRGLLDKFGWDPRSSKPVHDVSLAPAGLPLDHSALKLLFGKPISKSTISVALGKGEQDDDIEEDERSDAVEEIIQVAKAATPPVWRDRVDWNAFVDGLGSSVVDPNGEVPRLESCAAMEDVGLLDEFDELSSASAVASIDSHCISVATQARLMADRIGVPRVLAVVLELAAKMHDIGKADRRFQRWLDPNQTNEFLAAKSNTPRNSWERNRVGAGWPRGGRHETLSARLVESWLKNGSALNTTQQDLLLHLIITHHGKGRPLVIPVEDETHTTVAFEIEGKPVEVSASLSKTDWSQPARFRGLNEEFGPWGLALLETVLRQADQFVSGTGS